MKAVTYITENTIMKFLYNPKRPFLKASLRNGYALILVHIRIMASMSDS